MIWFEAPRRQPDGGDPSVDELWTRSDGGNRSPWPTNGLAQRNCEKDRPVAVERLALWRSGRNGDGASRGKRTAPSARQVLARVARPWRDRSRTAGADAK